MKVKFLYLLILLWTAFPVVAQQPSALDSAIQKLAKEKDPAKTVILVNRIIKDHQLDKMKDAETLDVLFGTAAINFALHNDYKQFEKYIDKIQNKFNQTSFLNMAASQMLNENLDAEYANKISKRTLELYHSFKDDTTAKPKDFSKADWQRFMDFAQYPYYDTYAQSLFALKQYDEALKYQQMAFNGKPEEGMPASVSRYAKLLELTGKKEEARNLLLRMARRGRLNKEMLHQLQTIYIADKGSDENLGAYLDSLHKSVQASMIGELKQEMLNETAPAFTLKDIDGKRVSLADYAGKIVVLDLWATWCKPCIASFPAMQSMVEKHPGVAFLFIAVDEKEKDRLPRVKNFIEKRNYPFTVLIDEPVEPNSLKYKITSAYKPNGIPAKYIIDKSGTLRFKTSGFDTDTELVNELEAMFTILNGL